MKNINDILQFANTYEVECINFMKIAKVRKIHNGKYRVLSENGRNLGTYNTKSEANKRLNQIEYFKHKDQNNSKDNIINLDITDFSYSAVMRKMREKASKEQVICFLKLFKEQFDLSIKKQLQKPERIALQNALISFNKIYPIKIDKNLIKNAATSELGNPVLVGKYLADIVRFTLNRISIEKRRGAIENLRRKFYNFNINEIASKKLPPSSAIGQSITFVKHVLFNHDAPYIREVLINLIRNLQ